jgi:hypothetical protein
MIFDELHHQVREGGLGEGSGGEDRVFGEGELLFGVSETVRLFEDDFTVMEDGDRRAGDFGCSHEASDRSVYLRPSDLGVVQTFDLSEDGEWEQNRGEGGSSHGVLSDIPVGREICCTGGPGKNVGPEQQPK